MRRSDAAFLNTGPDSRRAIGSRTSGARSFRSRLTHPSQQQAQSGGHAAQEDDRDEALNRFRPIPRGEQHHGKHRHTFLHRGCPGTRAYEIRKRRPEVYEGRWIGRCTWRAQATAKICPQCASLSIVRENLERRLHGHTSECAMKSLCCNVLMSEDASGAALAQVLALEPLGPEGPLSVLAHLPAGPPPPT